MMRFLRWLTLARLLVAITFAAVFVMAVRAPLDPDTFWHLRAGEWMVEHGQLLRVDLFSHSRAGEEWINHSYLSQLVLYGASAGLGNVGLALYVEILAVLGMAFVYRVSHGDTFVRGLTTIMAATTAAVFWTARPQMMSFALSGVMIYLLRRYLFEERGTLWAIPPLMVLWVNLHGGFAIGFILMVLALVGEVLHQIFERLLKGEALDLTVGRHLVVVGLVSAAAVSLNPYGPRMLLYPFQTVGISVLRDFILEWRSPDFHVVALWPFIWLVLGLLASVGLSARRLDWRDLTLVAGTAYMALLGVRNVAVFAVVALPVLSLHVSDWLKGLGWSPRFGRVTRKTLLLAVNWLLLALLLLAGVAKVAVTLAPAKIEELRVGYVPVEAVAYLQDEQPPGLLFNNYNWGGFLIWELRDYPVYVDGRTDLYSDELLKTYLKISFGDEGWQSELDEVGINVVLVEPDSVLAKLLVREPGWARVYADEVAVIIVRQAPVGAAPDQQ